jgi:hypothetical protein
VRQKPLFGVLIPPLEIIRVLLHPFPLAFLLPSFAAFRTATTLLPGSYPTIRLEKPTTILATPLIVLHWIPPDYSRRIQNEKSPDLFRAAIQKNQREL